MSTAAGDLSAIETAARELISALDAGDSDAILAAAADVQLASAQLASRGAWRSGDTAARDDVAALLRGVQAQIRAAELRVRFLTDKTISRLQILADAGVVLPPALQRALPSRLKSPLKPGVESTGP